MVVFSIPLTFVILNTAPKPFKSPNMTKKFGKKRLKFPKGGEGESDIWEKFTNNPIIFF